MIARYNIPLYCLLMTLALSSGITWAKTADDYYHSAAAMYIEGRQQQAGIEVREGLSQYPGDSKLSGLEELLKNLQNQEQQDNQQQQEKNQDEQKEQENQDDQKDEEQKQNQDQQEQEEKEQNEQNDTENEPQDSAAANQSEAEEVPEGEMSEDDAKRLLDAYKEDEKDDQKKIHSKKQRKTATDW